MGCSSSKEVVQVAPVKILDGEEKEKKKGLPSEPSFVDNNFDIFLSYAWGKAQTENGVQFWPLKNKAKNIYNCLKANGYKTWLDETHLAVAGDDVRGAMANSIRKSKAVVLCISDDYALSQNCKFECVFAHHIKKPVFWVNVGNPPRGSHQPGYDPNDFDFDDEEEQKTRGWLQEHILNRMWADCRDEHRARSFGGLKVLTAQLKNADIPNSEKIDEEALALFYTAPPPLAGSFRSQEERSFIVDSRHLTRWDSVSILSTALKTESSFARVSFGRYYGQRMVVKELCPYLLVPLCQSLGVKDNESLFQTQGELLKIMSNFLRRSETLRNLQHYNLVTVYKIILDVPGALAQNPPRSPIAIICEAMNMNCRDFLAHLAGKQALLMAFRLRLAQEVVGAVEFLHSENVVHGDIKLINVMVDSDGKAKLADAGLITLRSMLDKKDGGTVGTLVYMAPELFAFDDAPQSFVPHTRSTDMYSLGTLLWDLFTESPGYTELYPDSHNNILIAEGVRDGILRPSTKTLLPETPSVISRLIESCWSFNKKDRPTAEQVSLELASYLQTSPILEEDLRLPPWPRPKGATLAVRESLASASPLLPPSLHEEDSPLTIYSSLEGGSPISMEETLKIDLPPSTPFSPDMEVSPKDIRESSRASSRESLVSTQPSFSLSSTFQGTPSKKIGAQLRGGPTVMSPSSSGGGPLKLFSKRLTEQAFTPSLDSSGFSMPRNCGVLDFGLPIKGSLKQWRLAHPSATVANIENRKDLKDADFVYLEGIKGLRMNNCNVVTSVTDAAFAHLKQLHTLHMDRCSQESITDAAFAHLGGLVELSMWQCDQHTITSAAFSHLSSLEILNIGSCVQEEITDSAFVGLSRLRSLSIKRCSQSKLTDALFQYLPNLIILDMSRCLQFTDAAFPFFKKLQRLTMGECTQVGVPLQSRLAFFYFFSPLPYSLARAHVRSLLCNDSSL